MTVQTSTAVATGIGNGVTTNFPVGFKFNRDEDLFVILIDTATEEVEQLALNSDYTVQGAGNDEGGSITTTVPVPVGTTIRTFRIVDLLQLTDLRNQGKFFAEIHEDTFDLIVMMIQQQQEQLDRAVKVPPSSDTPADELLAEFKRDVADAEQAARDSEAARDGSLMIANKFGNLDQAISMTEGLRDETLLSASAAASDASRAETAADAAEAAKDAAFVNADVYPDVAEGRAEVDDGEQFQVVEGAENVRYRRDSVGVSPEVSRILNAKGVGAFSEKSLQSGVDFIPAGNLFDVNMAIEDGQVISASGALAPLLDGARSAFMKVEPGTTYYVRGFNDIARYGATREFIQRNGVDRLGQAWTAPMGTYYIRVNYSSRNDIQRGTITLGPSAPASAPTDDLRIPALLVQDVRPENTTFLEPSKNLFNPEDVEVGVLIDPGNGNIRPPISGVNDYVTTGFIKVEPGETYSQLIAAGGGAGYDRFITLACYSAHKNYIHGATGAFTTITLGTAVEYVRLTYRGSPDGRMFAKGAGVAEYVPYGAKLKGVMAAPVGTGSIIDRAVTPEKTTFIRKSKNLYNPETDVEGFTISTTGAPTVSQYHNATDFIPVKPDTVYSTRNETFDNSDGFILMAQYDENGNFIRRDYFAGGSITTRSNTAFVRLVYGNTSGSSIAVVALRMFFEGVVAPEFESYGDYIDGLGIPPEEFRELCVGRDRPMVDTPLEGLFYEGDGSAEYTTWGSVTAAQVYAMWDALMAGHPSYITKHPLGQDDFGNDVAYYKMTPERPKSTYSATRDPDLPRIFIVSSIHGNEKMPALTTYRMADMMCNNWTSDRLIEALRFNVELIIIPVANPSGWALNTRQNGNGVDLNRNFPEGWKLTAPGTNTYGGPEPFSEKESQLISQVFSENPGIDACYDFHNFGQLANNPFIWIPTTAGRYVERMGQMLIQQLTRKWRAEYPAWMPTDPNWFVGYTDASRGAMVQDHAFFAHGVKLTATFETSQRLYQQPGSSDFNEVAQGASLTAFVNWLLVNVREIVRRG